MDKQREQIELDLVEAVELGFDIDEALALAAGLIAEAEARFMQLAQRGVSRPPPVV